MMATSTEGTTTIFDARTLRPLKHLPSRSGGAALSPDGRTVLLGGRDGSVRFVDLVTGTSRSASGRHDGAVTRASFSADGRIAVTAGEDNRVIVWNVRRAAADETFVGHTAQITGLAISRDNRTLYTAAVDGKVILWDLAGTYRLGRPFAIGPGTPDQFPTYALRPDGRVLAIGHSDGTVDVVDPRTLQTLSSFRAVPHGPVVALAYAPRSALLVVGGDKGFLALVDPVRGKLVTRLRGHGGALYPPSFSADGRLMATTSPEAVILWDLRSGAPVARPVRSSVVPLGDASLSPDGRTLAIVNSEQDVEIVDVATLRHRAWLSQSESVGCDSLHAGRALCRRRKLQELGAAVVHQDRAACRPGASRAGRSGLRSGRKPGRRHPRRRRRRRQHPAVRPAHSAAARRAAARCAQEPRLPQSSRPTAPTCSPSPTPDAPIAGTCGRHRGRATPASWPGEPSPEPNGRPHCPVALMRPPARPDRHCARVELATSAAALLAKLPTRTATPSHGAGDGARPPSLSLAPGTAPLKNRDPPLVEDVAEARPVTEAPQLDPHGRAV